MWVWGSPGGRDSSGGPGSEMSNKEATLGGANRGSPPPGDGGGIPFCKEP